jgi:hypothetical protein
VLCGILGLIGYIHITLSDGGHVDQSDGAKSILLSYIQSISLLATFPIAWPDIFVTIFKIGGAVPGKKTFLCCVRFNVLCARWSLIVYFLLFVLFFSSSSWATSYQSKMCLSQPKRGRSLLFGQNSMVNSTNRFSFELFIGMVSN